MRAAFVISDSVNFIDNDGFNGCEDLPALRRGEEDVQRFGRSDQDVRRPREHRAALVSKSVAGAHGGAYVRTGHAALPRELKDFAKRRLQVFLNIVAQRLERRDVKHFGAVRQVPGESFPDEPVDADEKCRESFSRAGRRRDQRGLAGQDMRPALRLWLGWSAKAPDKPFLDQWVRPFEAS